MLSCDLEPPLRRNQTIEHGTVRFDYGCQVCATGVGPRNGDPIRSESFGQFMQHLQLPWSQRFKLLAFGEALRDFCGNPVFARSHRAQARNELFAG